VYLCFTWYTSSTSTEKEIELAIKVSASKAWSPVSLTIEFDSQEAMEDFRNVCGSNITIVEAAKETGAEVKFATQTSRAFGEIYNMLKECK